MRQVVGTKRDHACRFGCTLVQVTPNLWLCEHTAWGWASNLKGAEQDARNLIERSGGWAALRARLQPRKKAVKERTPKAIA